MIRALRQDRPTCCPSWLALVSMRYLSELDVLVVAQGAHDGHRLVLDLSTSSASSVSILLSLPLGLRRAASSETEFLLLPGRSRPRCDSVSPL
eukprot:759544-Hanusia_phi.AAC.2